ncbi:hypothetical protein FOZ63_004841 [Perkinsus olseni]|uniref:Uncharacterized protein n=1 Tax=Perkinsus olseni TaxID=32597 RepID=A0A7J6PRF7_PEROL|nr:hypothetical protein FOZ63_004841 [Perkinsus olseni]KAF4710638.1 hypothetical protein FOZ62_022492 [Perkinsus olseni]
MAQDLRALIDSAIEERRSRHQRAEPMTTSKPELIVVAAPTSSSSTTGSSTTASTSASITATTPEATEYEGHHRKRQQHHRHPEPKPSAGQGDLGESLGYGNGSELAMLAEHSQSEYNYAFDFTFDEPEKKNKENDDPGGPNLRGKAGESGRVGHREPMLEPEKPEESLDREHPVADSTNGREIPLRRREIEPYPPSEPLAGYKPSVDESAETADEELGESLVDEEEDGVAEEDLPSTDGRGEFTKEAAYDVWSPYSAELATEQTKPTNLPARRLGDNRDRPPMANNESPLPSIAASESDPTAETLESRPLFSGVNPTERTIAESDDDAYSETVEEVGKEDTRRTFGDEEPYSETVEEVGRPETRKTFGDRLDVKELEKLADEEPSEQEVLEAFKSAGLEEAFSTASKGEG